MNFTASYLNFLDIKILDELGGDIFTLHYLREKYPYSFNKPALSYSIIDDSKQRKDPVLKTISLDALDKKGFCIIKIPLQKDEMWSKRIKYRHEIVKLNNPLSTHYRKLTNRDSQVTVVFDEANLRIRIVGEKVNQMGASQWLDL